ncbi:hypothetical protein CEUSTIGMA_g12059.t1, partial [Chlamydomonas eustigma]
PDRVPKSSSLQLLLGNEVLDVTEQDVSSNNLYLFAVRSILQGQAHLTSRLAMRPASLNSGLHRKLRDQVDKRHERGVRVATHAGFQNPEADKARREAIVEERNKSREQLQRKQVRFMMRANAGSRAPRNARLSEKYLEEEQDWEADGGGGDDTGDFGGLTRKRASDYDEEASRKLSIAKKSNSSQRHAAVPLKKRRQEEDEEEDEEEYDDDEEEYFSSSEPEEDQQRGDVSAKRGSHKVLVTTTGKVSSHGAGQGALPVVKTRRGVVISDDEED